MLNYMAWRTQKHCKGSYHIIHMNCYDILETGAFLGIFLSYCFHEYEKMFCFISHIPHKTLFKICLDTASNV